MKRSMPMCCVLAVTALAFGAATVTLTLESPSANQTVAAGATITWTIKATVSTGDNLGLALLGVDLVQDPNNPAKFDLPAADPNLIPAGMAKFNRPLGITNPGENGAASGYIGSQRTPTGQTYKNLLQIGGAQNTFGQAGAGFGTDPVVLGGVGQSGAQTIASGRFTAPATNGNYKFSLANGVANVLTAINAPPNFSPVVQPTINLTGGTFTFRVGPTVCRGDCNCDGAVNFKDINPFVAALSGGTPCSAANCDVNNDGAINFKDINPFVALLSGGATCP